MERITPKLWSWASILDEKARVQAIKTAHMDIVHDHMALMPDAHWGLGCCVGAVIPTVGGIFPAAVGVDIGCGMIAVRTQFYRHDINLCGNTLTELRHAIESVIPVSAGGNNQTVRWDHTRQRIATLEALPGIESAVAVKGNWYLQLGSLGGGNHFIEVVIDEEGRVWLFLHSGSRGVGNLLARRHISRAMELCRGVSLPDRDLAYLTDGTPDFGAYIRDLEWAQQFARLNREEMMDRFITVFEKWIGIQVAVTDRVNCHHNYTEQFEDDEVGTVWLSRKGAINAVEGRMGLIPGSMSTASYVVRGLGNPDSWWSSPHGAGRIHGRNQAKGLFTEQDVVDSMKGIEFPRERAGMFIDEIAGAYKPVGQVMEDSGDLVEIVHSFHQILNVKGN